MRNSSHASRHISTRCCAICGGKFGLIRHYYWRTALCSKKCVEHFKIRREADYEWLRRVATACTAHRVPS